MNLGGRNEGFLPPVLLRAENRMIFRGGSCEVFGRRDLLIPSLAESAKSGLNTILLISGK